MPRPFPRVAPPAAQISRVVLLLSLLLPLAAPALGTVPAPPPPGLAPSPLEPASAGGVAVVERSLEKLTQHRRLLVVGAHPDDEDTTILTLVARGQGGESAYLSLSRGEGGQNLIGPELGVALGVIRSEELLAARSIDGGRQFFTRAYDFGYTRSLEETLEKWPREVLLEDVVRVVRRFRPQVVVSVFPPDPQAGHGQHQAAGLMAGELFAAAGDREAVPALAAEGLGPWSPESLFRATWWDVDATTLEVPAGRLDPLAGRTYFQLAMASRSQHRSQDMGRVQPLGGYAGRYAWIAGPGGPRSDDLFAGIDTRLEAIAGVLAEGPARQEIERELRRARERAEVARGRLVPSAPAGVVPDLLAVLEHLERAYALALEAEEPGAGAVTELVAEKLAAARVGLAAAAGVAVDAWTETESIALPGPAGDGEPVRVTAMLQASPVPSGTEVVPVGVELLAAPGESPWRLEVARDEDGRAIAPGEGGDGDGDGTATWAFDVRPALDARPTVPYFLARPLEGALYDWSAAPAAVRGEPFGPPPLVARFTVAIGGREIPLDREVVSRVGDQAVGEVRRPLRLVPALEVTPDRELLVWPAGDRETRMLTVRVDSNLGRPVAGRVRLAGPGGAPWPGAEPVAFQIDEPHGEATVELRLPAPEDLAPGRHPLAVLAEVEGGSEDGAFRAAFPVIDYPHIRATPAPRPAHVDLVSVPLELPRLERIAYVRGASDRVPEALVAIGLPVEILSGADLAARDLSVYDAVVVGSRAYETDAALARANPRLLDYARSGGLVVVQYQQYQFVRGGFAPLPLEIARPHDRVTDEAAPPTLLDPDHPVFHHPHRIEPADWSGWIQERGLYFAHTWDPGFTPLLAFPADAATETPGAPLAGGLLVAPVGSGTYVYTGLAFFRQLPAGVPGAYRLFLNLLALGEAGP